MAGKIETEDLRYVLRRISPYIIRQWKQLCLELGVQEKELLDLEENTYNASLSHLALKGLYLWYDKNGKQACKTKLINALQTCGLGRAEEEIESLDDHSHLNCNTSLNVHPCRTSRPSSSVQSRPSSRQRPKSRGPVIKPKKSSHTKNNKNGFVTAQQVNQRTGSSVSVRTNSVRSKSGRRRRTEDNTQNCQLRIRVKVSRIQPVSETGGIWREKYHDTCEKFYNHVLNNRQNFIESLQHLIGVPQFTVCDIRGGSLLIVCQSRCLGALESVNQMCKSRRLNAICQTAFITKEVLELLDAKSVTLDLELKESDLEACRDLLLSRKFKVQTSLHPTDTLLPPTRDDEVEDTAALKEPLHFEEQDWKRQLNEKFQNLANRYKTFDDCFDEFLRTLQIILPTGKETISSLSEIIELHGYLSSTKGVSSGVRTDMVREYLSIINCVRLLVADIEDKLETLYVLKQNDNEGKSGLELNKCLVNDIQDMLVLTNTFIIDFGVIGRKLRSVEKSFCGLTCFVPLMLAKLQTVIHILISPN